MKIIRQNKWKLIEIKTDNNDNKYVWWVKKKKIHIRYQVRIMRTSKNLDLIESELGDTKLRLWYNESKL